MRGDPGEASAPAWPRRLGLRSKRAVRPVLLASVAMLGLVPSAFGQSDLTDQLLGNAPVAPAVRRVIDDLGRNKATGAGAPPRAADAAAGQPGAEVRARPEPPPEETSQRTAAAGGPGTPPAKSAADLLAEVGAKVKAALAALPDDVHVPTVEALHELVDPGRLKAIEAKVRALVAERLGRPDATQPARVAGGGAVAVADAGGDRPTVVPDDVAREIRDQVTQALDDLVRPIPLPPVLPQKPTTATDGGGRGVEVDPPPAPERDRLVPGVARPDAGNNADLRRRIDPPGPRRPIAEGAGDGAGGGVDRGGSTPGIPAQDRPATPYPHIAGPAVPERGDFERHIADALAPGRPDVDGIAGDITRPAGVDGDRIARDVSRPEGLDADAIARDITPPQGVDGDRIARDVTRPAVPDRDKLVADVLHPDFLQRLDQIVVPVARDQNWSKPSVVMPDIASMTPDVPQIDADDIRKLIAEPAPEADPSNLGEDLRRDVTTPTVARPDISVAEVKLPDILDPGKLRSSLPPLGRIEVKATVPEDVIRQALDNVADRVKREVGRAMDGLAAKLGDEAASHAKQQSAYLAAAAAAKASRPTRQFQIAGNWSGSPPGTGMAEWTVNDENTGNFCILSDRHFHDTGAGYGFTWTQNDVDSGDVWCSDSNASETLQSRLDQQKVDQEITTNNNLAKGEGDQVKLYTAGAGDIATRKTDILATIDQAFAPMNDGIGAGSVSYVASSSIDIDQAADAALSPRPGTGVPENAQQTRDVAAADPHHATGPRVGTGSGGDTHQVLEIATLDDEIGEADAVESIVAASIGAGTVAEVDVGTVGRLRAAHIENLTQKDLFTDIVAAAIGASSAASVIVGTDDADIGGDLSATTTVGSVIAASIGANTLASIEVDGLQGSFRSGTRSVTVPSVTAAAVGYGTASLIRLASSGPFASVAGAHRYRYDGPSTIVAAALGAGSVASISAGNIDGQARSSLDMDIAHGDIVAAAIGADSEVTTRIGDVTANAVLWGPAKMKVRTGEIVSFALGADTTTRVDVGVVDAAVHGPLDLDVSTGALSTGTIGVNTETEVAVGVIRGSIGGPANIRVSTGEISTFAIGIGNAGGVNSKTFIGSVLGDQGGGVNIDVTTGGHFNLGFGIVLDLGPLGTIRLTRNGCISIGNVGGSGC